MTKKRYQYSAYTLAATLYANKEYDIILRKKVEFWIKNNRNTRSWLVKQAVEEFLEREEVKN